MLNSNYFFHRIRQKTLKYKSWRYRTIQTLQFCCQVDGVLLPNGNHHLSALSSLSITFPPSLTARRRFCLYMGKNSLRLMVCMGFKSNTPTGIIDCCCMKCNMENRALTKIQNISSDPFLGLKNMHHLQQLASVE